MTIVHGEKVTKQNKLTILQDKTQRNKACTKYMKNITTMSMKYDEM
jgi:hypothetical protein